MQQAWKNLSSERSNSVFFVHSNFPISKTGLVIVAIPVDKVPGPLSPLTLELPMPLTSTFSTTRPKFHWWWRTPAMEVSLKNSPLSSTFIDPFNLLLLRRHRAVDFGFIDNDHAKENYLISWNENSGNILTIHCQWNQMWLCCVFTSSQDVRSEWQTAKSYSEKRPNKRARTDYPGSYSIFKCFRPQPST